MTMHPRWSLYYHCPSPAAAAKLLPLALGACSLRLSALRVTLDPDPFRLGLAEEGKEVGDQGGWQLMAEEECETCPTSFSFPRPWRWNGMYTL